MKLNKFILKTVQNSIICYLLREDYRCVHQGTEEECREYANNSPGTIIKII